MGEESDSGGEELIQARAALERERQLRLRAEARYEQVRQIPLARRLLKNLSWNRENRWAMRSAAPSPTTPLFFIVGRGKSGTSWLMEALDQHPEILCKGEGQFFGRGDEDAAPHARSLYRALLDSAELREWSHHSAWTRGVEFGPQAARLAAAAAAEIMGSRLEASGKRIAGDKTPLNGPGVVEQIVTTLPEARVVHVIRDGRDAAVSAVHHIWNNRERITGRPLDAVLAAKRDRYRADPGSFGPGGESLFTEGHLEGTAARWRSLTAAARSDGRGLLANRYLEVRYEEMLEAPEAELRRVLDLLGADSSERVAAACIEASSFERRSGREPGEEDPSSFRRKGVAGDWRTSFTAEDRDTFKRVAGKLLIELDYERDNDW